MPIVVAGENPLEAWRQATEVLLRSAGGEVQDLVVDVRNPAEVGGDIRVFDARSLGGKDRVSDVANTIFPLKTWLNSKGHGRSAFYERYLKADARSRHRRWGTYFGRLIAFGSTRKNQMEESISAAAQWKNSPKRAICWHLSSPETDSIRPLGSPCLQVIQVHCHADRVDFSAFYRNHDYFEKALGNFIGLGRLLSFFAAETGRNVGRLVCYSTHAYSSGGKLKIEKLASP